MKKQILTLRVFLSLLLMLLIISCQKESKQLPVDDALSSSELSPASGDGVQKAVASRHGQSHAGLVKMVRSANARFHSTTQAIMAGFEPTDDCVAVPGIGGMGYHWVNPGRVDPAFDPLQPEVVLYESGPGGSLKLVAVEYVVIDIGQDAPMFGDQPFDVGGAPLPVPHWTLHVWLYKDNPSGMFAKFNPNVSCP